MSHHSNKLSHTTKATIERTGSKFQPETLNTSDGSLPGSVSTRAIRDRWLQSYVWENNSCAIDVGLELWFRAFVRWPAETRQNILNIIAHDHKDSPALLCRLLFHFQSRLVWCFKASKDVSPPGIYKSTQGTVRVFADRWGLLAESGYMNAADWLSHTLEVCTRIRDTRHLDWFNV